MTYLTILSLHLIAMVAWFAAMFYLPRLFVYHTQQTNGESSQLLETMEYRLYRMIMTPAALLTLVFGLWLTVIQWSSLSTTMWFWIKVVAVIGLFGYHGTCGAMVKSFKNGSNTRSERFFRVFNEIPLLFLVAIIFLAVFKPS